MSDEYCTGVYIGDEHPAWRGEIALIRRDEAKPEKGVLAQFDSHTLTRKSTPEEEADPDKRTEDGRLYMGFGWHWFPGTSFELTSFPEFDNLEDNL